MKDKKCCKDFEYAESYLNSAIVFVVGRGWGKFSKPFKFCPYCKTKISLPKD